MNREQKIIFKKAQEGTSLFITGSAGVGKSYLISEIIQSFENRKLGVCAMTGAAAVLINGTTLHSFMGIGLGTGTIESLLLKMKKYRTLKKIKNLEVLIVDEVSMLGLALFETINELFKNIKGNRFPFGGIQLILVGDPFQLSPVKDEYCFLSPQWDSLNITTCKLNTNMRTNQNSFKELLDNLRFGICTESNYSLLHKMTKTEFEGDITPTRLFSMNRDSEEINSYELKRLIDTGAEKMTYPILRKNKDSQKYIDSIKLDESLELCVGAQVVVTRNINIEDGIVNGTRGVITQLTPSGIYIKRNSGVEINVCYFFHKSEDSSIEFEYLPIRLAWAISIHSSQGMTLDAIEIDLGKSVFACGQAYTGLSRGRNAESIKITKLSRTAFKTNKNIIDFYNKY